MQCLKCSMLKILFFLICPSYLLMHDVVCIVIVLDENRNNLFCNTYACPNFFYKYFFKSPWFKYSHVTYTFFLWNFSGFQFRLCQLHNTIFFLFCILKCPLNVCMFDEKRKKWVKTLYMQIRAYKEKHIFFVRSFLFLVVVVVFLSFFMLLLQLQNSLALMYSRITLSLQNIN